MGLVSVVPLQYGGPSSVGLEVVQTAALMQIVAELDGALTRQSQAWDPVDQRVAQALRIPYRRCVLERPPKGCVYPGVRPGVLDMPWDRFPALYLMADRSAPTLENAVFDQATHVYAVQLYVEGFVRSDPFDYEDRHERLVHEGLVDRRCKRMIEAVVECVQLDPTLGGVVPELPAPTAEQTDPFTLQGHEPREKTRKRVFSALRIVYAAPTYAARVDAAQPVPGVLPTGFGSWLTPPQ